MVHVKVGNPAAGDQRFCLPNLTVAALLVNADEVYGCQLRSRRPEIHTVLRLRRPQRNALQVKEAGLPPRNKTHTSPPLSFSFFRLLVNADVF